MVTTFITAVVDVFSLTALAVVAIIIILVSDKTRQIAIKEYLKERERQKTIRQLAEIQREREALGVAEERELFEDEDIDINDIVDKTEKEPIKYKEEDK